MSPLFVYGTLLRGEPNHRLLATAVYRGPARTAPAFTLIDLGGFPALLDGGTTAIAGELYDVGHATLAQADRLEGHPHFYERVLVDLLDSSLRPYAYLLRRKTPGRIIVSGSWVELEQIIKEKR